MIKYFLFDLDNTLYLPEKGPLKEVDRLMTEYISTNFNLTTEKARYLRKDFYYHFGTTLGGLIHEYQIDPIHFLEYVHDIDPKFLPQKDSRLHQILANIPQKKFIVTNSYIKYAKKVVEALKIGPYIEEIYDVVFMEYNNKINQKSFHKVINNIEPGIHKSRYIMFDDVWRYLKPAKELSIRTVLVNPEKTGDPHYHLENIYGLETLLPGLLTF